MPSRDAPRRQQWPRRFAPAFCRRAPLHAPRCFHGSPAGAKQATSGKGRGWHGKLAVVTRLNTPVLPPEQHEPCHQWSTAGRTLCSVPTLPAQCYSLTCTTCCKATQPAITNKYISTRPHPTMGKTSPHPQLHKSTSPHVGSLAFGTSHGFCGSPTRLMITVNDSSISDHTAENTATWQSARSPKHTSRLILHGIISPSRRRASAPWWRAPGRRCR